MGTDPDRCNSELNSACAAHNSVSVDGRTHRTGVEPEASPLSQFDTAPHAPFDLAAFPDEVAIPAPEPVAAFAAAPAVVAVDTAVVRLPNGLIVRTTRRPSHRRRSAWRSARRILLAVDAAAADLALVLHRTTRRLRRRGRVALAQLDTKGLLTKSNSPRLAAIATVSLMIVGGLVYFSRPNPSTVSPPAQVGRGVTATAPRAQVARTATTTTPPAQVARTPAKTAPAAQAAPGAAAPVPALPARVKPVETSRVRETGVAATTGARTPKPAKAETRRAVESGATIGALNITSQPAGAEVSVNGVRQGQTPVVIRGLRAGSRVVSLSLPGYERWSWSVAVVADRLTPVNVKLQPDSRPSMRH